jgi:hypothetical protein
MLRRTAGQVHFWTANLATEAPAYSAQYVKWIQHGTWSMLWVFTCQVPPTLRFAVSAVLLYIDEGSSSMCYMQWSAWHTLSVSALSCVTTVQPCAVTDRQLSGRCGLLLLLLHCDGSQVLMSLMCVLRLQQLLMGLSTRTKMPNCLLKFI